MSVVFDRRRLVEDANCEKGDREQNDGSDDQVSSADFHHEDFAPLGREGKPEERGLQDLEI